MQRVHLEYAPVRLVVSLHFFVDTTTLEESCRCNMARSSGVTNSFCQGLTKLTAFTDLAPLNTGFALVLGEVLAADLRFYAAAADAEDYALLGQYAPQLIDQSSGSFSQTASQLGSDRSVLNKLGRNDACTTVTGSGVHSMFQQRINAQQKVFIVVDAALLQEQLDFVHAGLKIYVNQARLLKRTTRDSLTNLLNRDALERRMRSLCAKNGSHRRRSMEPTSSGCFAIADLDKFKRVNDTYGHVCGDKVLIMFAQIMRDSFRDDDVLCRFGGEEFVIVLADIDVAIAMNALQRFRQTVANTEFPQGVSVTVSIGCTQLNLNRSLDMLTAHADRALYYAKAHGRNRLCCYEDLLEGKKLEQDAELLA